MAEVCSRGSVVWMRGGYTTSARRLTLQADQNLVLYDSDSYYVDWNAAWSTGTDLQITVGTSPTLRVTEDAVELVNDVSGLVVWAIRAGRDFVIETTAAPIVGEARTYTIPEPGRNMAHMQPTPAVISTPARAGCGWTRKCGDVRRIPGTSIGHGGCIQSPSGAVQFGVSGETGRIELCTNGTVRWTRGGLTTSERQLLLQYDRNLVLYGVAKQPIWSTDTYVHSDVALDSLLIMNEDAVELYRGTLAIPGELIWRLRADGEYWEKPVVHTDGGILVSTGSQTITLTTAPTDPNVRRTLKTGESLKPGEVITSPNGRYRFGLEPSGAITLRSGDALLWYKLPHPEGKEPHLDVQRDANMVWYATVPCPGCWQALPRYDSKWYTGTAGRDFGTTTLSVHDNCDVVLTNEAGDRLWSIKDASVPHLALCKPPPAKDYTKLTEPSKVAAEPGVYRAMDVALACSLAVLGLFVMLCFAGAILDWHEKQKKLTERLCTKSK